ncbi:unnamed protein product [Rotaria sp. Silwood1]|nr:unnamed protein product [Rotaria sp. Silwood1]
MPAANPLSVAGNQVSDFYLACRNGDINAVKRMLCDKKRVNINRMEPNGSTALHAASYFGQADIVELLLKEKDIIVSQKNIYGFTAYQETTNDKIRQIFVRFNREHLWD